MKIKDWWRWVNSKPWYLRWFVFFMLLRPIAEQFYDLKDVSPLFSPLYWMGALTFIFSVWGIASGRRHKSRLDKTFSVWSILILLSTVSIYFSSTGLVPYIGIAIKLVLPILLYYFLRNFIYTRTDLVGLVTTFLLSCIYPIVSLVSGISSGYYFSAGRFAGAYADVFNNAFYLSFGFIALLYHYMLSRTYHKTLKLGNVTLILSLVVAVLGLWAIKHMATIAVFIGIIGIFIFIALQKRREAALLMIFLSIVFILFAGDTFYEEVVNPRLEHEVEVIEGTRDIDQALHGRMSRWSWLVEEFNDSPLYIKLLGYPLSLKYSIHMVGVTPHNDFLRILFFTGFLGLLVYLVLLYKIFRNARNQPPPEKFLFLSILMATTLYSISTVPTFYPGFVNILMIVFAASAIPLNNLAKNGR